MATSISMLNLEPGRPRSRSRREPLPVEPAREARAFDYGQSVSRLDEARRRLRSNMRAIPQVLRFGSREDPQVREEVLSEMENRLQSTAGFHKTLCRAGNFEKIDLAVFLNHAAKLRQSPPQFALEGGWLVNASGTDLCWALRPDRGDAPGFLELDAALHFLETPWRRPALRALYACAVVLPPWSFRWRTPRGLSADPAIRGSEVSVRVRVVEESLAVDVELSSQGAGLPGDFGAELQRRLAADIASVLAKLHEEAEGVEPAAAVSFKVAFVP